MRADEAHQQEIEHAQWWAEHNEDQQMKVGDVYQTESSNLAAADLNEKAIKLTITRYETVTFDEGLKIVLKFERAQKGLVLNKTNAMRISANLGSDDVDGWIGKDITIYPTTTDFGGKVVPCIRVKEEMPAAVMDPADFNDDIPF